MAERRWVDMRVVTVGRVDRVRIEGLDIRLHQDHVHVRQKFLESETVRSADHVFDCEDVRWVRPTKLMLDQVRPLSQPRPVPGGESVDDKQAQEIVDAIVSVVSFTSGEAVSAIRAGANRAGLDERQVAMWCAFEMTDLSLEVICKREFGYLSTMPLATVLSYIEDFYRGDRFSKRFVERVRAAATGASLALGYVPRRSALVPDWKRVL
jgi:hypothetical protein